MRYFIQDFFNKSVFQINMLNFLKILLLIVNNSNKKSIPLFYAI